jgi:hypothetical protein
MYSCSYEGKYDCGSALDTHLDQVTLHSPGPSAGAQWSSSLCSRLCVCCGLSK